jgi:hypothetical protein
VTARDSGVTHPELQVGQSSAVRDGDGVDEVLLEQAMREVPKGAMALAGTAVALLTIGWVLIYLLVFVPRGVVG